MKLANNQSIERHFRSHFLVQLYLYSPSLHAANNAKLAPKSIQIRQQYKQTYTAQHKNVSRNTNKRRFQILYIVFTV